MPTHATLGDFLRERLRTTEPTLRPGTFDLVQTIIWVRGKVSVGEPKTLRGRRPIALDPATIAVLKVHRKTMLEDRMQLGAAFNNEGLVFHRPDGRCLRRATLDIDLYRAGYGLEEAVDDLRQLADRDLGDHFRFVHGGHRAILAGDEQPYTEGYRVEFDTYIGVQKKGRIGVDLSTGAGLTAEPTVVAPASALDLPRLVGFDYRLYRWSITSRTRSAPRCTGTATDRRAGRRISSISSCLPSHTTSTGRCSTRPSPPRSADVAWIPSRASSSPPSGDLATRGWRGRCPTAPTCRASTSPAISSRRSSIPRWTPPPSG